MESGNRDVVLNMTLKLHKLHYKLFSGQPRIHAKENAVAYDANWPRARNCTVVSVLATQNEEKYSNKLLRMFQVAK